MGLTSMQALDSTITALAAPELRPSLANRFAEQTVAPPTPLLARGGRMFCDANGTWWCAYECDRDVVRPNAGRSLVFESLTIMRRVRQVPAGWWRLSAQELEALSWQR